MWNVLIAVTLLVALLSLTVCIFLGHFFLHRLVAEALKG